MLKIGIDLFSSVNVVLINCEDTRNVKLIILLVVKIFAKKLQKLFAKSRAKLI